MKINHIAIWVSNLEVMKNFYCGFFAGSAGPKYHNSETGLESYFITFEDGARLELMTKSGVKKNSGDKKEIIGIAHFAVSVGSEPEVDRMAELFRLAGCTIVSEPRTTGDGYYESCILDPEGNHVEITK